MALFIHHCDLRISDNTTINHLITNDIPFNPIFIFTPEQIIDNPYKSENSIQFMIESLIDLEQQYKKYNVNLHYFLGDTIEVLEEIVKDNKIDKIAFNEDYSPYAKLRDHEIEDMCNKNGIEYICLEDKLLNPIDSVLTQKGDIYKKFTPYFNRASELDVRQPSNNPIKKLLKPLPENKFSISISAIDKYYKKNSNLAIRGGTSNGKKVLDTLENFEGYNDERNIPSINTTRLSAHLKFGTISIRETFYTILNKLGADSELIKQLYWRDFYSMILHNFGDECDINCQQYTVPVTITKPNFQNIEWENDPHKFKKWTLGQTGCPIVDAGMREMNTTGFMHNRLRMIVAMYLIYYLKIDWRWGMKYFSQKLVDADWANNTGNWQWCAGTETWSNDYYRVFSMESQIKRFDPECEYIKKWVPELANEEPSDIIKENVDYLEPIIEDLKEARKEGIDMYKESIEASKE